MSIADYRIVQKPFNLDTAEKLRPDQVVDVSGWRNLKGLEGGRYLRRPTTEDDYALIREFMEVNLSNGGVITNTATIVDLSHNDINTPKRGRPPKNGSDDNGDNR